MLDNPPKFTISRQEQLHFAIYADRFASWGILFDFVDSATNSVKVVTSEEPSRLLCVTALPPSISERCQADAQLLISFLRTAVWKYANDLSLSTETSLPQLSQPLDWIGRLVHCPEGLVDIVNSRACRSAIMFNDELDMHQSRGLVQKLARCAFPFVCAHGRPSMVPLGDLGSFAENTQSLSLALQSDRSNFVQAWKHWTH
jgi:DNA mismatch repair protein MLH3